MTDQASSESANARRLDALRRLRRRGQYGIGDLAAIDPDDSQPGAAPDVEGSAPLPDATVSKQARKVRDGAEMLDYMERVPQFEAIPDGQPGSSSPEELDHRLRELRYRVDWLEALLELTRDEIKEIESARKRLAEGEAEPAVAVESGVPQGAAHDEED